MFYGLIGYKFEREADNLDNQVFVKDRNLNLLYFWNLEYTEIIMPNLLSLDFIIAEIWTDRNA